MSRSTGATVAARARSSLVCLTVVYVCILPIAAFQQSIGMARGSSSCSSRRTGHTPAPVIVKDSSPVLPARAFAAARGSGFRREPSRRNWWVAAGSSAAAVQDAPPTTNFDCAQISNVLEHEYRADLVRLAQKYGELIESAEDVETISIMELDGDHMQLDVVYCDEGEQTCVAVAVPIAFPHHCHDGNSVIDAIHELDEMEYVPYGGEIKLPQKAISPELMETIARICVVMNRDFQDELVGFVRAFGGKVADEPLGGCEMLSLTPDGFLVQAALLPYDPVPIAFPKECLCAQDFQTQILEISKQAMMVV